MGGHANTTLITYGFILLILALIVWRRTRAMTRPIRGNGLRILVPLIFILPGLSSFLNQSGQMVIGPSTGWELLCALLIGMVMAIPLIFTTNYEIREDGEIYAKKSIAFVFALVVLVVLRLVLRNYLVSLNPRAMAWLVYTMAIGYVLPWRIVSYIKFRKVYDQRQSRLVKQTPQDL